MLSSRPTTEEIVEKLRETGNRATTQRLTIYNAMWDAGSHPTVADIHVHSEKRDPTISLATVYKALQLFTKIGLAIEMGFRDESTRYDPAVGPHVNLICINCGTVEDCDLDRLGKIKPDLEKRMDFEVLSHRFEVHGLCSKCRQK
ncbi:MAG: Fur family transcriptional regulator [Candidatus Thorarchaeota archaeon]